MDIAQLIPAVIEAGACVMAHRAAGVQAEEKSDLSPVTIADREAEAILLAALAALAPGIPVIAEEEAAAGRLPDVEKQFFLVDPLDGTKEYVKGGDDFTVNVALIDHGVPVAGIVYAPAQATLWWGDAPRRLAMRAAIEEGKLAHRRPIGVRPCGGRPKAVASKSHPVPATEAFLAALLVLLTGFTGLTLAARTASVPFAIRNLARSLASAIHAGARPWPVQVAPVLGC